MTITRYSGTYIATSMGAVASILYTVPIGCIAKIKSIGKITKQFNNYSGVEFANIGNLSDKVLFTTSARSNSATYDGSIAVAIDNYALCGSYVNNGGDIERKANFNGETSEFTTDGTITTYTLDITEDLILTAGQSIRILTNKNNSSVILSATYDFTILEETL